MWQKKQTLSNQKLILPYHITQNISKHPIITNYTCGVIKVYSLDTLDHAYLQKHTTVIGHYQQYIVGDQQCTARQSEMGKDLAVSKEISLLLKKYHKG